MKSASIPASTMAGIPSFLSIFIIFPPLRISMVEDFRLNVNACQLAYDNSPLVPASQGNVWMAGSLEFTRGASSLCGQSCVRCTLPRGNFAARRMSQIRKHCDAASEHVGEGVDFLLGISRGAKGVMDLLGRKAREQSCHPLRIGPGEYFYRSIPSECGSNIHLRSLLRPCW